MINKHDNWIPDHVHHPPAKMLFIILAMIAAALLGVGQATPPNLINIARDDVSITSDPITAGRPSTDTQNQQKNPNLTQIICQPQMYLEARKDFTKQSIDDLRSKNHAITLGANTNHGNCTRVSCEYASAIYVCNDNGHDVEVELGTVADYAQAVVDDPRKECNWHVEHYKHGKDAADLTWGQAFDVNGWLVWPSPLNTRTHPPSTLGW